MRMRILLALGVISLAFAPMVSAQQQIGQLTTGLNDFVNNSVKSLPFAASAGMDWSNAYIGQLVDTDFPFVHLGLGADVGLTTLPSSALTNLLATFGQTAPPMMGIPFMVINGRVGGFLLPFDIGFKVGYLPNSLTTMVQNFNFTYNNFGLDVRYDLVKSDFVMPDVSVGVGFNYLDATASTTLGSAQSFGDGVGNTLTLSAPVASLEMKSTEFEAKVQVSKTLFYLLTPYVGGSLYYGTGSATAGINSTISTTGAPLSHWTQYFNGLTAQGLNISNNQGVFGLKFYGGTSVNITIVKVDVQGMYNLLNGDWGVGLGGRIQL